MASRSHPLRSGHPFILGRPLKKGSPHEDKLSAYIICLALVIPRGIGVIHSARNRILVPRMPFGPKASRIAFPFDFRPPPPSLGSNTLPSTAQQCGRATPFPQDSFSSSRWWDNSPGTQPRAPGVTVGSFLPSPSDLPHGAPPWRWRRWWWRRRWRRWWRRRWRWSWQFFQFLLLLEGFLLSMVLLSHFLRKLQEISSG